MYSLMGYATTERRMGRLMMRGFDNEEGTGGGMGEGGERLTLSLNGEDWIAFHFSK